MQGTVFVELRFWLLVLTSLVLPVGIYAWLLARQAVSTLLILVLGMVLLLLSGIDVYLLQSLANTAKHSISLADDALFLSEVSVALYLLPVLFGGIGVNLVSHVLIRHLEAAEAKFDRQQQQRNPTAAADSPQADNGRV